MQETKYCQSCAMPLEEGMYGTEAGGAKSEDYCKYCYENGKFTMECTMEEMINFCAKPMAENTPGMTEEQAKEQMRAFFPQLKRWA